MGVFCPFPRNSIFQDILINIHIPGKMVKIVGGRYILDCLKSAAPCTKIIYLSNVKEKLLYSLLIQWTHLLGLGPKEVFYISG